MTDDDFGFDWRNTPSKYHPGGPGGCVCPRCEALREKEQFARMMQKQGVRQGMSFRFCPDHYRLFMDVSVGESPLHIRLFMRLAMKVGAVKVLRTSYMDSDSCFYCKYGSGGADRRAPTLES